MVYDAVWNLRKKMIITCPSCEKNFQVNETLLKSKRTPKLKCSACQHVWVFSSASSAPCAHKIDALKKTLPEITKKEDDSVQVYKVSSKQKKLVWTLYLLIAVLITLPILVFMRYHVVAVLPQTEAAYEALGLPVNRRVESFSFSGVTFFKEPTEDGWKLTIRGKIRYEPTQQEARIVPHVRVTVYGKADCEKQSWWERQKFGTDALQEKGLCKIDSWSFAAKDNLALPGETVEFEQEKIYSETDAAPEEINLQFVENTHVPRTSFKKVE